MEHQVIIEDLWKTEDLTKWYQLVKLFQTNEQLRSEKKFKNIQEKELWEIRTWT